MAPKKGMKYLPVSTRRQKRPSCKSAKIKTSDAFLYVQWEVPQFVELSPVQWEILTSSLCYDGALSKPDFEGNAELTIPILKIRFPNSENFRAFQMKAILVPRHTAYHIYHVCSSGGSACCIVASR